MTGGVVPLQPPHTKRTRGAWEPAQVPPDNGGARAKRTHLGGGPNGVPRGDGKGFEKASLAPEKDSKIFAARSPEL